MDKMTKHKAEFKQFEEILEREVKPFGNTGHIIVGKKHIGKKTHIIVNGKINTTKIKNKIKWQIK